MSNERYYQVGWIKKYTRGSLGIVGVARKMKEYR